MYRIKLDFSWIERLGKCRRENRIPKEIIDFKIIDTSAFDGSKENTLLLDECGVIEVVMPQKVYGILRGRHFEYEELDDQLFLSKDRARNQCLLYVETANFKPYQKEKYAEIREGYWRAGEYQFIELNEFTLS